MLLKNDRIQILPTFTWDMPANKIKSVPTHNLVTELCVARSKDNILSMSWLMGRDRLEFGCIAHVKSESQKYKR